MAGNKNLAEDPYERLANAIILQAVADYRVALKKIKAHPKDRKAIDEALEIERFFRSGWYNQLTSVEGIPDQEASGRSETIRVNPREKKIQLEVAYEQTSAGSQEIFITSLRVEPADREQARTDRGSS